MCNCSNFEGNDPNLSGVDRHANEFINNEDISFENASGVDRHANSYVDNEDISFENANGSYGDIDDLDADTMEDFEDGVDNFGGYDTDEDFDNFDPNEDLTDEDFDNASAYDDENDEEFDDFGDEASGDKDGEIISGFELGYNADGDDLDEEDFDDQAFKGGSGYEPIGSDSQHYFNFDGDFLNVSDAEFEAEVEEYTNAEGEYDDDDEAYELGEAMDTFVDDDFDNADAEDLDEEDFDDQDFDNADAEYLDEEDFDDQDFESADGKDEDGLDYGVAESFEGDDFETIGEESQHKFDGDGEEGDGEFDDFLTKRSRARRKLRRKLRKGGMSRKEARKKAVARVPKQKIGRLLKHAITFKTDPETTKIIKSLEKEGVISPKKDGLDKVAEQIETAVNENVEEGTQNMGTETPTAPTTPTQAGGTKGKMGKMVMIGVGVIVLGFVAYKIFKK